MGLIPIYLFLFFLTVVVTYLKNWYGKNKEIFEFAKKYSGPLFIPFIGNAYVILPERINNTLDAVNHFMKNYSLPTNIWIGHDYYYFNISPNEAKTVLSHPKSMDKGMVYKDFNLFFKESLILLPYNLWKPRRKLNSRCFKMATLKSFIPIFNQRSEELIRELSSSRKEGFNLFSVLNYFMFTTFAATSFGMDSKTFPNGKKFAETVMKVQDQFGQRLLDPIIPTKLWLDIFPLGRKVKKMVHDSQDMLKKAFATKIRKFSNEKASNFSLENNEKYNCQLDFLIKEEVISEEALLMEMTLFTLAATDTTGHSLGFCLTLLGMYPEIQAKVYDEVMSVTQGREFIENDDVLNLTFTEAVILETLRLFPPIPLVARYATANIDLGDKIIPKGANILVPIFHLHRDPRYWPNPEKFDPDRFLAGNVENIVPNSFLPFSSGPRNCIGKMYSLIQMKITIASIVRVFKISSKHRSLDEFKLTSCISLNTREPVDCQFTFRK